MGSLGPKRSDSYTPTLSAIEVPDITAGYPVSSDAVHRMIGQRSVLPMPGFPDLQMRCM